jgi:hypothetical protein
MPHRNPDDETSVLNFKLPKLTDFSRKKSSKKIPKKICKKNSKKIQKKIPQKNSKNLEKKMSKFFFHHRFTEVLMA